VEPGSPFSKPQLEVTKKTMISSRIGRLEFLFWCSAPIVLGSIVMTIAAFGVGAIDIRAGAVPKGFIAPAVLVASVVILKAEISRFHDLGWSGWAALLAFVPLVGVVTFLFLILAPGQKTTNAYGEPSTFLEWLRKSSRVANS
jgi:uncharacterized membrane protein YhaH (DUF805 family)